MRDRLIAAALVGCFSYQVSAQNSSEQTMTYPSAQNETPPSAEKQKLIGRFMRASGLQAKLDNGSFLHRYASISELHWHDEDRKVSLLDAITNPGPVRALKTVYEKYRQEYQEAYESHINWEYTEDELRQMAVFLESPAGQHYLHGTWRTDAYTSTNMEETEEVLVNEAVALYRSTATPRDPSSGHGDGLR
ncbi:MAG TPA: DUF2059 domain-containing protein [Croceibacterium sp.]|nr:DUF2059 domain-containing protein [Croceibacterium sp.]